MALKKSRKLNKLTVLSEEEVEKKKKNFHDLLNSYQYRQDLSEQHLSYLEKISKEESDRLLIIENKLAQIVGQTGILLTLISLFAPIFYDKLDHLNFIYKIIILFLFGFGFLFFIISIFQATKSFNIKNFIYVKQSVHTVLNKEYTDPKEFILVQVKDLIQGITNNIETNNTKGSILLNAHRAFRTGILLVGILGVLIISLLTFK